MEQNFKSSFSIHKDVKKNVHNGYIYIIYILIVIQNNKIDSETDIYLSLIDSKELIKVHTYQALLSYTSKSEIIPQQSS